MTRTFLAIAPPQTVRDEIDAIQTDLRGANWTMEENLHLTLLFLGDQNRRSLEDLDSELIRLRAAPFALQLQGVGHFGGREPRLVYAGAAPCPELHALQSKIENAARAASLMVEARRYTPHVTLARWGRREVGAQRLQAYVERENLFQSSVFNVSSFTLFRSDLHHSGAIYTPMAEYELRA